MRDNEQAEVAFAIAIGRVVAGLRQRGGLSQQELAGQLGLTQSTLSRVERGASYLSPFQQRRLAEVFHVDVFTLATAIESVFERGRSLLAGLVPSCEGGLVWTRALELGGVDDLRAVMSYVAHGVLEREKLGILADEK